MNFTRCVISPIAIMASFLAAPCSMAETPNIQLENSIALPGNGKTDYASIDPQRHRLYITHGNQVQVIDLQSQKEIGSIAGTEGVHGVDFAPEFNLGFTSNGRSNSVTVFALDTLAVKQQVKVGGRNPDAILYVPQLHQLYTFNGGSADVSVFDVPSMRLAATIKVGGRPEFAVHDGAGHIYVNIEDKNALEMIDAAAGKVAAHWPLTGCEEPTGLAFDSAQSRLFSVCGNKVAVVTDARSGKQIANFEIGAHPDAAAYDPATGLIYVSNGGSATLTVARQNSSDHYEVLVNAKTVAGAKTMAFDSVSKRVYLPVAIDGNLKVMVISAGSN